MIYKNEVICLFNYQGKFIIDITFNTKNDVDINSQQAKELYELFKDNGQNLKNIIQHELAENCKDIKINVNTIEQSFDSVKTKER